MEKIKMYRTYSYGGMDGTTLEKRTFKTMELAIANAKKDKWNSDFSLYEVIINFNDEITETENFIKDISSKRDIESLENWKYILNIAENRLEGYKANKRMKETNRIKKIAEENEYINLIKEIIKNIENNS